MSRSIGIRDHLPPDWMITFRPESVITIDRNTHKALVAPEWLIEIEAVAAAKA
jgi:hypothetical protein